MDEQTRIQKDIAMFEDNIKHTKKILEDAILEHKKKNNDSMERK